MSRLRVRKTLSLACLALFTVGLSSHAEEPTVEQVRYRPFSLFSRNRSGDQDEKQKDTKPSLQEPLAAPPSNARYAQSAAGNRSSSDSDDPLVLLVERAIVKTSLRRLDANQHRPWQITHGLLALRTDFELRDGNRTVNAIEWISNQGKFRNTYWFEATQYGARAHPYNGVPYEFEGHVNQTLALLAMSNLPLTHEFIVAGGRKVTMADMVRHAQMTVSTKEEITWTLWFLTHYLDIDSEWTNAAGEPWSLEELVRLQTKGKVVGAPCGGTHGLFAIAYARNAYLYKHGRLRGVWYEADQKIQKHIELARSLQNYDGTFSTEMFKGPGHSRDFNERIKSSGHMLEWLMMSVPHARLSEPWIRRGIAAVATDLVHNASQPAECGPLYHALNSLILYRDRVAPQKSAEPEVLAESPEKEDSASNADEQIRPPVITALPSQSAEDDARADGPRDTAEEQNGPALKPLRIVIDPEKVRRLR